MNSDYQQHSARTRLRSKHRVIPSIFLQNVIAELEESAVLTELQQQQTNNNNQNSSSNKQPQKKQVDDNDTDNSDNDDEDGEREFERNKNLSYRFTTQFDEAKKQTRDIFNRVRTAEKVIHNFGATTHSYVYGQTLQGGGKNNNEKSKSRKLDLANASRRLTANKRALLSDNVLFGNINEILRDEDIAEMAEDEDERENYSTDKKNNNEDDEDEEQDDNENEDDDEVQRLLGDDWR